MSLLISTSVKNILLDTFATSLGANPKLRVYALAAVSPDPIPSDASVALTNQVLLGTLSFSNTPFEVASNGSIVARAIAQDLAADATGVAAFFRIMDSGTSISYAQGSIGLLGSGADMILNTTSIVALGPISVTSLVISI